MLATLADERLRLHRMIEELPDDKVHVLIDCIYGCRDCEFNHEPNEETIKAIEDVRTGRNLIGPFDNAKALLDAYLKEA